MAYFHSTFNLFFLFEKNGPNILIPCGGKNNFRDLVPISIVEAGF